MIFSKKKKLFFFFWLAFILSIKAGFVFAAETDIPATTLPDLVSFIFSWVMATSIYLALAVIIFGGILYLISFSAGKIVNAGKEWVKAGILGLLLLVCSWLILNTINPDLLRLRLTGLLPLPPTEVSRAPNRQNADIPTVNYAEIPIGKLTETLLSRTINCYDFDSAGEPIDGDPATKELEPTLLNHDRADCIIKLAEAVEKQAQLVNELSKKIADLMKECSCKANCDLDCITCAHKGACPRPAGDVGKSISAACGDCAESEKTACKAVANCCPPATKDKIEHGPIPITTCPGKTKNFKGLDELRSDFKDDDILAAEFKDVIDLKPGKIEKVFDLTEKEKIIIIDKERWNNLKLVDKLRYLKEKLMSESQGFGTDLGILNGAESQLNGCYFARPYAEFLNLIKETSLRNKIVTRTNSYKDPYTKEKMQNAKYCEGFGYEKSSCFQNCQKICPLGNEDSFNALKKCAIGNTGCIKDAVALCPAGTDYNNLFDCVNACRGDCEKTCSKVYKTCPTDEAECKRECKQDSTCLIKNSGDCYFKVSMLKECADLKECSGTSQPCASNAQCNTSQGQSCQPISYEKFKGCADRSYLCKYCTDQNSGYPDCAKNVIGDSSSSYLFSNPKEQKCETCFSEYNNFGVKTIGLNQYPECEKCPSCSDCPKCPCGDIKDPAGTEYFGVCGSSCQNYLYSDDPLTFFCPNDFSEDESFFWLGLPLGMRVTCQKNQEIPVGRAVDESEDWASSMLENAGTLMEKTDTLLKYIKQITEEKNYCECDSKCSPTEPVCFGSCTFQQKLAGAPPVWDCYCLKEPCSGNPCQKMINMLLGKKADDNCPKGTEYDGVELRYNEVKSGLETLLILPPADARSEALKKLIYSRKKMDQSSQIENNFPDEVRLLNCKRVANELISPARTGYVTINERKFYGFCYGQRVGAIFKLGNLLDDWFYCQNINSSDNLLKIFK